MATWPEFRMGQCRYEKAPHFTSYRTLKYILVQILYDLKDPTEPYPKSFIDVWDENHVRMPFSTKNIYPVKNGDKKELCSRWELIQNALRKELLCAEDLEDAILSYNMRFKSSWEWFEIIKDSVAIRDSL